MYFVPGSCQRCRLPCDPRIFYQTGRSMVDSYHTGGGSFSSKTVGKWTCGSNLYRRRCVSPFFLFKPLFPEKMYGRKRLPAVFSYRFLPWNRSGDVSFVFVLCLWTDDGILYRKEGNCLWPGYYRRISGSFAGDEHGTWKNINGQRI